MSFTPSQEQCPCNSGEPYARCCAPYHRGARAPATAEALMRARFSAYAVGEVGFLLATWHPKTRPATLRPDPALRWCRLEILATREGGTGDDVGTVQFRAHYMIGDRGGQMEERSRFERVEGEWRYLDGEVDEKPAAPIGRNTHCPCGSGQKYKRCCLRKQG